MNRICAILPLKAFEHAKSRLSPLLAAGERSEIARLMAVDSLRTLAAVPELDRIVVAGQGAAHAALAARFGCRYIADDPALDVSGNVLRAARLATGPHTTTLLYVAADLPLLEPGDVSELLARHEDGVTICRAARDNGTNALLASPPALAHFSFGSNSAQRHAAAAIAAGARVQVLDLEPFRHDLDEPADFVGIVSRARGEAAKYIRKAGLGRRAGAHATAPLPA